MSSHSTPLPVVAGFIKPGDPGAKLRPAIVVGQTTLMGQEFLVVVPSTTVYERTGKVPYGGVLVQENSPAFKATGLAKESCMQTWNACVVPRDSAWTANMYEIGKLDLNQDPRLRDRFGESFKQAETLLAKHLPEIIQALRDRKGVQFDGPTRSPAAHEDRRAAGREMFHD